MYLGAGRSRRHKLRRRQDRRHAGDLDSARRRRVHPSRPKPARTSSIRVITKHSSARPSRTLDPWLAGDDGMRRTYWRGTGDICVVEGVMGLYDGRRRRRQRSPTRWTCQSCWSWTRRPAWRASPRRRSGSQSTPPLGATSRWPASSHSAPTAAGTPTVSGRATR